MRPRLLAMLGGRFPRSTFAVGVFRHKRPRIKIPEGHVSRLVVVAID